MHSFICIPSSVLNETFLPNFFLALFKFQIILFCFFFFPPQGLDALTQIQLAEDLLGTITYRPKYQ